MLEHLKRHWKTYAIGAAVAAGVAYGVPPEISRSFVEGLLGAVGQ